MTAEFLLDEHVSRVFERVLRERGYRVEQAKDRLGERTTDLELLGWCRDNGDLLVSNNVKDFEPLHRQHDHAGVLVYHDQDLPDVDPEIGTGCRRGPQTVRPGRHRGPTGRPR